jgi:hypothetical protein
MEKGRVWSTGFVRVVLMLHGREACALDPTMDMKWEDFGQKSDI